MWNVGRKQKHEHHEPKNVGRDDKGRFITLRRFTEKDVLMLVAVFLIGFLTAYSASAKEAPPSEADWAAWSQLKPAKKFDYNKVYNDIDSDLARLDGRAEQFAQNLPLQLSGPMHAIGKKQYRGRNARLK